MERLTDRERNDYQETIEYLLGLSKRQAEVIAACADHILEQQNNGYDVFKNVIIKDVYNSLKTHMMKEAEYLVKRTSRRENIGH